MKSAWVCVLCLAFAPAACATSTPQADDVADTLLGLDGQNDDDEPGGSECARDEQHQRPEAARPIMQCIGRVGASPPPAGVPVPDGAAMPAAPDEPVVIVVEHEVGLVACGCGAAGGVGIASVPGVPGVPPSPGGTRSAGEAGHTEHGAQHTSAPGTPAGEAHPAGVPAVGGTASTPGSGAHGTAAHGGAPVPGIPASGAAPALPPSCEQLVAQCYTDERDVDVCEQFAACCQHAPVVMHITEGAAPG
jgi:hypothetical protein